MTSETFVNINFIVISLKKSKYCLHLQLWILPRCNGPGWMLFVNRKFNLNLKKASVFFMCYCSNLYDNISSGWTLISSGAVRFNLFHCSIGTFYWQNQSDTTDSFINNVSISVRIVVNLFGAFFKKQKPHPRYENKIHLDFDQIEMMRNCAALNETILRFTHFFTITIIHSYYILY